MIIQPCPGCAATNQVQLERIAALEADLAAITRVATQYQEEAGQLQARIAALEADLAEAQDQRDDAMKMEAEAAARHRETLIALADARKRIAAAQREIAEYNKTFNAQAQADEEMARAFAAMKAELDAARKGKA